MKYLIPGEHFGANKKKVHFRDYIFTEAGYEPGIAAPWHYHENAYFYYHLQGTLLEVNKKQKLLCQPGTVLFHSWQDPHYDTRFSTDVQFFHIELNAQWFQKFDLAANAVEGSKHLENPVFKSIFQKIYWETRHADAATPLAVEGLLMQAYAEMIRYEEKTQSFIPAWVEKVRQLLHEHDTQKITLELLAAETGVHAVHISRAFARYFNTSFGNYIRNIKLQQAVSLLADKNKSITDIAYSCGYADQSHFIRHFKKVYGMSPLKYRKLYSGL